MKDVFSNIWCQDRVRDYFRNAFANGSLSHAYLLYGPAGSGKTNAAFALAAASLCGCGECPTCERVLRRKHPDVHYVTPEGAQAYLVGQVRKVIDDVSLAPIQAKGKVYIINRADLLNTASANAFLKTLEEPPEGVTLILLARTCEAVLPTIASRCSLVPFATVPERESVGVVQQNAGVTFERARKALASCDGSVEKAVEFAKSNERFAHMREILEFMGSLRTGDELDVMRMSKALVSMANAPLDSMKLSQAKYLEDNAEFLSSSAVSEIKKRDDRFQKAAIRDALLQETVIIKSWLRDVLCMCASCREDVVHTDMIESLRDACAHTRIERVVAALQKVDDASDRIYGNVSPQTCFDALLLDIREVLYDPNCNGQPRIEP